MKSDYYNQLTMILKSAYWWWSCQMKAPDCNDNHEIESRFWWCRCALYRSKFVEDQVRWLQLVTCNDQHYIIECDVDRWKFAERSSQMITISWSVRIRISSTYSSIADFGLHSVQTQSKFAESTVVYGYKSKYWAMPFHSSFL